MDSGVVYLVESPEGYVAYSKAATVTVSKAKQYMKLFFLLNSSETHRYFCRNFGVNLLLKCP